MARVNVSWNDLSDDIKAELTRQGYNEYSFDQLTQGRQLDIGETSAEKSSTPLRALSEQQLGLERGDRIIGQSQDELQQLTPEGIPLSLSKDQERDLEKFQERRPNSSLSKQKLPAFGRIRPDGSVYQRSNARYGQGAFVPNGQGQNELVFDDPAGERAKTFDFGLAGNQNKENVFSTERARRLKNDVISVDTVNNNEPQLFVAGKNSAQHDMRNVAARLQQGIDAGVFNADELVEAQRILNNIEKRSGRGQLKADRAEARRAIQSADRRARGEFTEEEILREIQRAANGQLSAAELDEIVGFGFDKNNFKLKRDKNEFFPNVKAENITTDQLVASPEKQQQIRAVMESMGEGRPELMAQRRANNEADFAAYQQMMRQFAGPNDPGLVNVQQANATGQLPITQEAVPVRRFNGDVPLSAVPVVGFMDPKSGEMLGRTPSEMQAPSKSVEWMLNSVSEVGNVESLSKFNQFDSDDIDGLKDLSISDDDLVSPTRILEPIKDINRKVSASLESVGLTLNAPIRSLDDLEAAVEAIASKKPIFDKPWSKDKQVITNPTIHDVLVGELRIRDKYAEAELANALFQMGQSMDQGIRQQMRPQVSPGVEVIPALGNKEARILKANDEKLRGKEIKGEFRKLNSPQNKELALREVLREMNPAFAGLPSAQIPEADLKAAQAMLSERLASDGAGVNMGLANKPQIGGVQQSPIIVSKGARFVEERPFPVAGPRNLSRWLRPGDEISEGKVSYDSLVKAGKSPKEAMEMALGNLELAVDQSAFEQDLLRRGFVSADDRFDESLEMVRNAADMPRPTNQTPRLVNQGINAEAQRVAQREGMQAFVTQADGPSARVGLMPNPVQQQIEAYARRRGQQPGMREGMGRLQNAQDAAILRRENPARSQVKPQKPSFTSAPDPWTSTRQTKGPDAFDFTPSEIKYDPIPSPWGQATVPPKGANDAIAQESSRRSEPKPQRETIRRAPQLVSAAPGTSSGQSNAEPKRNFFDDARERFGNFSKTRRGRGSLIGAGVLGAGATGVAIGSSINNERERRQEEERNRKIEELLAI